MLIIKGKNKDSNKEEINISLDNKNNKNTYNYLQRYDDIRYKTSFRNFLYKEIQPTKIQEVTKQYMALDSAATNDATPWEDMCTNIREEKMKLFVAVEMK